MWDFGTILAVGLYAVELAKYGAREEAQALVAEAAVLESISD